MYERFPNVRESRHFSTRRAVWRWAVPVGLVAVTAVVYGRIWQQRSATIQQGHLGFRQIAMALANYAEAFGTLPPSQSGTPGYSWRFAIQPFIEGPGVAGMDPAVSWNDPRYATWAALRHPCYSFGTDESKDTNVVAVVGTDTAWNLRGRSETSAPSSDTLLCVECRGTGVHWMEPGDLNIDDDRLDGGTVRDSKGSFRLGNGCGGIHLLFGDFTVWYLSDATPIEEIRKFMTMGGDRKFDRDAGLKAYRLWEGRLPHL
jgi:hypothetical protein